MNYKKMTIERLRQTFGKASDLQSKESDLADLKKWVENRMALFPNEDDMPLSARGAYDAYLNVKNRISYMQDKKANP